ncbi:prepilin peptidase [Chimaeribacter californicus]|uniref:Prepilin leader peptidase/N-methyltransferase n=1 Tax=Chimaeribacter californicus TaxID=2060067 RepID=A0A2N5DVE2_9GAMM|nr:A24 family peptidase [Chimaeribacter californicus]PLR31000.1 prepilin peptidase [Chimaeribacter californicus]
MDATSTLLIPALYFFAGIIMGKVINHIGQYLPYLITEHDSQEPSTASMPHSAWKLAYCSCHPPAHWHDYVPVFSWLALRGRCRVCSAPISPGYLWVELICGILALCFSLLFPPAIALALAVYSGFLLTLSLIDARTFLLPDKLTLPLLWLGLLFNSFSDGVSLTDAVYGAVAGYLLLWSLYWFFRLASGREGLGYGDFKLLAALGAWTGWQMLPQITLLAAASGLLWAGLSKWKKGEWIAVLPFGPPLAAAGWLTLLIHWYIIR